MNLLGNVIVITGGGSGVTFAKLLLVISIGIVSTAISIKIVDGLAKKIGGYTNSMIRQLNR